MAKQPEVFEVQRRYSVENFGILADRNQSAFVELSSGLSHGDGFIRFLMSPEKARLLGRELQEAATFAEIKTLTERYAKPKDGPDEVFYGTTEPQI